MGANLHILLINIVIVTSFQLISSLRSGTRLPIKLKIFLFFMLFEKSSVTRTSRNCQNSTFLYPTVSALLNETKFPNILVLSIPSDSFYFFMIYGYLSSVVEVLQLVTEIDNRVWIPYLANQTQSFELFSVTTNLMKCHTPHAPGPSLQSTKVSRSISLTSIGLSITIFGYW